MGKQKVLITTPGCVTCDALEAALKHDGLWDKVTVVDASTPEGLDFARRLGVKAVPECAVVEEDGNETRVRTCSQEEWIRLLRQGE